LRLVTRNCPWPNSRRRKAIPASVPMNVESMTGQLHRSTANSRKPRFTISFANSFKPVLFKNEPLPSTRTQTVRLAIPTRMEGCGDTVIFKIRDESAVEMRSGGVELSEL